MVLSLLKRLGNIINIEIKLQYIFDENGKRPKIFLKILPFLNYPRPSIFRLLHSESADGRIYLL